jgi:hypothetical protein
MNCFYKFLLLFLFARPFWYGPTVCTDVVNPQAWNEPLRHLALLAAAIVAFLVLFAYAWLTERRVR